MSKTTHQWWKEGVCYQVWPASFKDSNADGLGDLQGVISKLDYLKDLGVDYVWLSPCYDSPRRDMGYDIRNYEDIDPEYGALQDMDELIKSVHDRGMRLVLDLVVNHTSSEHKWFQESMKSRNNEFSDYYIWRDPKIVDGKKVEPNNWSSVFGGTAWKYVESRDQYYLHLFHETQPDTNWEIPKVRQALYKSAIRFWLDRGIDGFRVDAVGLYSKPLDFPDAKILDPTRSPLGLPFSVIANGPRMHEFLKEQRKEALDPYGDVVLIGELGKANDNDLLEYLDPKHRELDMIFDMSVIFPDGFSPGRDAKHDYSLPVIRRGLTGPQHVISHLERWSSVFIENHDNPRSITKFGSADPALRVASGKCLALLLCTLSGTLFIYQGQEIGMTNLPKAWPLSDLRDEYWKGAFEEAARHGPTSEERAKFEFQYLGRDHSRTPVQWNNREPAAGFSTVEPWMKVNPSYKEGVTVEEEQNDPDSLWHFWKKTVALRKSDLSVYVYGATQFLDVENDKVMYFTKKAEGSSLDNANVVIVLNFSDQAQTLQWPHEIDPKTIGKIVLSTTGDEIAVGDKLAGREGRVYELK